MLNAWTVTNGGTHSIRAGTTGFPNAGSVRAKARARGDAGSTSAKATRQSGRERSMPRCRLCT